MDHHTTRDELADDYLIDETAAANCLILHQWASALDWTITPQAAEAMVIGIAMDTGWFRHSNTDARVFTATADLVQRGVKAHELHQQLFMQETPARIALLGAALCTLELLHKDRLGVMTLSTEVMAKCGGTPADTEDIVNEPLRIESVMASVLLVEQGDGLIRCSFRSKPPEPHEQWNPPFGGACAIDETPETPQPQPSPLTKGGLRGVDDTKPMLPQPPTDINVAVIAQTFGGGGHARAAGARISGKLGEVRRTIINRFREVDLA